MNYKNQIKGSRGNHLARLISLVVICISLFGVLYTQEMYTYAKDKNPLNTANINITYKKNKIRFTYHYRMIETKKHGTGYKVSDASFKIIKKKNSKIKTLEIKTWALGDKYNENCTYKGRGKSKTKSKTFKNPKVGKTYKLNSNQAYYYTVDPGRSTILYKINKNKDFLYGWGWIGGGTPR